MVDLRQAVTAEVHDRLRLFEGNVADQRFVAAVGGFHLDEQRFCEDRSEAPETQYDGAADFARHDRLVGGFDLHRIQRGQLAELASPCVRQRQVRGPGVDQGIADDLGTRVGTVLDGCFDDDAPHAETPERQMQRDASTSHPSQDR